GGRAVRAFGDQLRLDAPSVLAGDLVFAGGEGKDVARQLQQLLVRDPLAALIARKRAVFLRKAPQRRDVEPELVVDAAGEIRDRDDLRALVVQLAGRN